jgi:hypothetical protein
MGDKSCVSIFEFATVCEYQKFAESNDVITVYVTDDDTPSSQC